MQVVRVQLVGRNNYGFLVFDYLDYSNAIAKKKLTSNVAIWGFWDQVKKGLNKRGV